MPVISHGTAPDEAASPPQLPDECEAARELLALAGMVNQAVGDALSGLLLVEAALRRRAWGLAEWGALYDDLPSRQLKARARLSNPTF